MVRQVRMKEIFQDPNTMATTQRRIFAFGTHVDALTKDYPALGPNAEITAVASAQSIRVIMDELLVGNELEEIACRAPIDGVNAYDRVPNGTTPDDIARCASAKDVLPSACPGTMTHAVCICRADGGCGTVAKGDPVGVLDVNQDGAADTHRFISTSVGLKCGSMTIPADPAMSYWYPSGDQLPPAQGGIEEIGPAVVFYPATSLPTNTTCSLVFADDVVDKTDIKVCAPMGGRTTACSGNLDLCQQTCTPGDVSAFSFKTAPLALAATFDSMGVDKTLPLVFVANTAIDMASITAPGTVTMTQAGANFTGFTVMLMNGGGRSQVYITPTAATWQANTTYTITFSTALKDTAGSPLPAPLTFTFTTGA